MQSLLGLFYNKIKGSQEDIASEGLAYILNNSIESGNVINEIISSNTDLTFPKLLYKNQSSGDNLERPDISGVDEDGKEVVLIEAKFWASLTHNQPSGYLERLDNDTVLIFLVPTLRIRAVFDEVLQKIQKEYSGIEVDAKKRKIRIVSTNQYILFKSWNKVLNQIKSKMTYENDPFLISDVNQIIGFCDIIDNNSFKPIMDKDLSQDIPKQIHSYYDIVDNVVDELNNQLGGDMHMLNRTAQRYGGYHRYFGIENIGFAVCMKMDLWAKMQTHHFGF